MSHFNQPRLSLNQFYEEFFVACKGLEHKYHWTLTGVSTFEADGVMMTVFEVKEIAVPIAFPASSFASLVHYCFYTQDLTLCDVLNKWFSRAKKEMEKKL